MRVASQCELAKTLVSLRVGEFESGSKPSLVGPRPLTPLPACRRQDRTQALAAMSSLPCAWSSSAAAAVLPSVRGIRAFVLVTTFFLSLGTATALMSDEDASAQPAALQRARVVSGTSCALLAAACLAQSAWKLASPSSDASSAWPRRCRALLPSPAAAAVVEAALAAVYLALSVPTACGLGVYVLSDSLPLPPSLAAAVICSAFLLLATQLWTASAAATEISVRQSCGAEENNNVMLSHAVVNTSGSLLKLEEGGEKESGGGALSTKDCSPSSSASSSPPKFVLRVVRHDITDEELQAAKRRLRSSASAASASEATPSPSPLLVNAVPTPSSASPPGLDDCFIKTPAPPANDEDKAQPKLTTENSCNATSNPRLLLPSNSQPDLSSSSTKNLAFRSTSEGRLPPPPPPQKALGQENESGSAYHSYDTVASFSGPQ